MGTDSFDSSPRPERKEDIKQRLRRIMVKIHPDLIQGAKGVTELPHAHELFTLLSEVADSNQLHQWPHSGTGRGIHKTIESKGGGRSKEIPKELHLVRINEDGKPELSPEAIKLPARPGAFIEALESYLAGDSWEEVLEKLRRNPEIKDAETKEQLETIIDSMASMKDVGNAAQLVSAADISDPGIKSALERRVARRFEKFIDKAISECIDLESLRVLHDDAKAFFNSRNGALVSQTTIMDALDGGAVDIAQKMFDAAVSKEEVSKVAQEISKYPFEFKELHVKPLEAAADDTKTKIRFLHAMRRQHTEPDLDALRSKVEAHLFSNATIGEQYRAEILSVIDRKRTSYKDRFEQTRTYLPADGENQS